MQPHSLGKPEEQVHIMYGLSACSLQKVVNHRGDKQFIAVLFKVNETLVCVYNLLEVYRGRDNVCKGVALVVALVDAV